MVVFSVWLGAVFDRKLRSQGSCGSNGGARRSRLIAFFSRSKLVTGSELTKSEHRRDFCRYLATGRPILFSVSIKAGYEPTSFTVYITS